MSQSSGARWESQLTDAKDFRYSIVKEQKIPSSAFII